MLPTTVLFLGVVLNALMAGLYFGFTTAVMPGLAHADDRTYVTAMQRIDRAIQNPWFFIAFLGALVVPGVAVLLHLGDGESLRLPWIVGGAVSYGLTLVITGVINIPLNNRLAAAGAVDDRRAASVRAMYHRRWVRANDLRTALCVVAVVLLLIALTLPIR
ncbi:MAG: DUF1772 domain-containing protein [Microbacterium sp.]|jgi:uncharacterized membrane protein|nr:DUF1772 domain-containing protein [Microbacterium sp.]